LIKSREILFNLSLLKKHRLLETQKEIIAKKEEGVKHKKEERLFFDGVQSRRKDFIFIIKILKEFIKGFRALNFVGPCATVFGSARFKENHPVYELSRKMGAALADLGFTVITGGGPGVMEAANRGAKEAGGKSVGCNIMLPEEQLPNKYLDKWVNIHYFFVRKVLLSKYSYAFIVMPGGFGTLDEFFEALTLIQTKSTRSFPVILMDKKFHEHLIAHIDLMTNCATIGQEDKGLFLYTDYIEDAIAFIEEHAIKKYGLRNKKGLEPIPILGEKKL
jgi:uncharacterized protein (TIGR00730 family)